MEIKRAENKIISDATKNIVLMFSLCLAVASFIFAAKERVFEYRPIVVTSRTVALNTAYQPSISRSVNVSVSCKIVCTATLVGGQDGSIALQVSADNGVSDPYTTIATMQNNNSVSLAIALTAVNGQTSTLNGVVKPGYYYKLIPTSTTGTPSFSVVTPAQETQL